MYLIQFSSHKLVSNTRNINYDLACIRLLQLNSSNKITSVLLIVVSFFHFEYKADTNKRTYDTYKARPRISFILHFHQKKFVKPCKSALKIIPLSVPRDFKLPFLSLPIA